MKLASPVVVEIDTQCIGTALHKSQSRVQNALAKLEKLEEIGRRAYQNDKINEVKYRPAMR